MTTAPRTVELIVDGDGRCVVRILDQTRLPTTVEYRDCRTVEDVWEAIRNLRVRGAPAIGVAAAMGMVLSVANYRDYDRDEYFKLLLSAANHLRSSRPTAVNLFWALDRMEQRAQRLRPPFNPGAHTHDLILEAFLIAKEDCETCRAIGRHGAELVPDGGGVLTHCNAGALATADYGTALSVLYTASEQGKRFRVYADETRPLLQGARLTAWELMQRNIPVTLICDSVAAQVMREGKVQMVVVGADRIAANGDTANKIGTYGVALLAQAHGIPFFVAAPGSTFDLSLPDGDGIPIEQRSAREVTHGFGTATAPEGVDVYNPAFDVTPAQLLTGIITDKGIIRPVTAENVRKVVGTVDAATSFSGLAAEVEPICQS